MSEFRTDVDIGNRALQRCGAFRMGALGFAEDSKNASEVAFCYGKLREAELRRNVWTFATKRAILRAVDVNTMLLNASLWSASTTYFVGSIVTDQYQNLWISRIRSNLANDPLNNQGYWEPYFGPMSVSLYTSTVTYQSGELVYTTAGDGTSRIYMSLENNNSDNPATPTAYDATVVYSINQVVTSAAIAYMSLIDFNKNNTPASNPLKWTTTFVGGAGSAKWLQIGGAEFPMGVGLLPMGVIYPLNIGPALQAVTRNYFKLPAGFLREAPQDPGSGTATWLGGPTGIDYSDWTYENGFMLTSQVGPIPYRFVANITDVSRMDPMFCEGLAARVALEVCETLTQSSAKLGTIARIYDEFIGSARTVNAIEQGPDQPPDDDYLVVRL
jgi:hypothetical protein